MSAPGGQPGTAAGRALLAQYDGDYPSDWLRTVILAIEAEASEELRAAVLAVLDSDEMNAPKLRRIRALVETPR